MSNENQSPKLKLLDGSYRLDHADSDLFASGDNENFQHICPSNPMRTCNCGQRCADVDFEEPSKWAGPCVVVGE